MSSVITISIFCLCLLLLLYVCANLNDATILSRTLLCCEDNNFTVERVSVGDNIIRNHTMSLIWAFYGITIPIILAVGIFGNVAILIVLSGPMFRGIAYLYLSGLALAHIGVVSSWITISLYNIML